MVPPGRGDLLNTLIGRTGKNFIVKAGGAMSTGVRGLTTRGGIGENAFLRAGGGVAQLGEHHVRNVGVEGSIPFSSTTFFFVITNIQQGIEPASGADATPCRSIIRA